ncbi:MAG: hypothetical protein JO131_07980 [Gammaproteobacteria bacterium]|nr:hypothetical protein [Gammaproteobacteria bacterium]
MSVYKILNDAISKKHTISFKYDNLDRIVEPHHYGTFGNAEHLHGYQIAGESTSGHIPKWGNFKLTKIKNLSTNDNIFTPEKTYNPSNSHYKNIIKKISTKK